MGDGLIIPPHQEECEVLAPEVTFSSATARPYVLAFS